MPSSETDSQNYLQKYRNLKRKLKILIYENECFQEELKKAQRKLLKVTRDKSFLLDRLLKYETVESSSSDSEATISSDSDNEYRNEIMAIKKKKLTPSIDNVEASAGNLSVTNISNSEAKKKKSRKACPNKPVSQESTFPPKGIPQPQVPSNLIVETLVVGDGHMTSEEIERHLEAKQSLRDLIPEKTPLTVPAEMFSTEPSVMECEVIDGQLREITSTTITDHEETGLLIHIPE